MQKDVIYIDVEDDITAIISKVNETKQKIVALVPPKRIGVLQSAVNLRLIARAASQHDKKLVLITNNDALSALAASAKIPVAKNLQSRPELGEIAALDLDDGDDVIDGSQLPVGEHAKQAAGVTTIPLDAAAADVISDSDAINIDGEPPVESPRTASAASSSKKRPKVPNFNTFRKKFVLFGCLGVLLIAFLVWAIFFAGRATIYITAKTTDASINDTVSLSTSSDTDAAQKTLRASEQTLKKDVSIDFTATGTKNVGDKATGTVDFSNNNPSAASIPAGSQLQSGDGKVFITNSDITVPGATLSFGCGSDHLCPGTASGGVTASEGGSDYNGESGSVSGAPSGVSAHFDSATSGGTDKTVKVVTKSDLAKAKQQFDDSTDADSAKSDIMKQFGKNVKVIPETFDSDTSDVKPNPAVGGESSDGSAKLAGTVVYTMYGVSNDDLSHFLDSYFKSQLDDQNTQRIYDNGTSTVAFSNVESGKTVTAQMTADGKIGPKIEDSKVKKLAEGKRYGEIQQSLQSIQGVSNVDTKYWPFWVSRAPNNPDRISVKFKIDGEK